MSSWQTRAVAAVLRTTRRPARSTRGRGLRALTRGAAPAVPPRAVRRRVVRRHLGEHGQHAVDRVMPDPPTALVPGTAVVHLHGGAFVDGIARQHWALVADLADATGAPVYVPHYGRVPRHTVDDVDDLFAALVEHITRWDAPRDGQGRPTTPRLHLAGDSAGGALALLLAQRLRGDDRVQVTGLSLIAPALDLSMTNPEIEQVEPTDPWLTRAGVRPLLEAWAGDHALDDPRVSPLFGDLSGLPPIHVFSGTRDICWPDAKLLERRAREAGTEVTLHVAEGSPHVHVLLPTPEGRGDRATLLATARESLRR